MRCGRCSTERQPGLLKLHSPHYTMARDWDLHRDCFALNLFALSLQRNESDSCAKQCIKKKKTKKNPEEIVLNICKSISHIHQQWYLLTWLLLIMHPSVLSFLNLSIHGNQVPAEKVLIFFLLNIIRQNYCQWSEIFEKCLPLGVQFWHPF